MCVTHTNVDNVYIYEAVVAMFAIQDI